MGQRINWALDGTLIYARSAANATSAAFSSAEMLSLDELQGAFTGVDIDAKVASGNGIVLNFPSPISVDKIGLYIDATETITIDYSLDATGPGSSTTWTSLVSGVSYSPANSYQEFSFAPVTTQWLRVYSSSTINLMYSLLVFGEYTSPRFEFWSNDTTPVEFTANYPMLFPTIGNDADSGDLDLYFKLKNTHTSTHSYSLEVQAVKYNDATETTLITSNITVLPTTITNLASGALSDPVRLRANFSAINNPADGYHYFKIVVTETA
jgi:hypothetical protein